MTLQEQISQNLGFDDSDQIITFDQTTLDLADQLVSCLASNAPKRDYDI